ncbi:MAG: YkgJ family cysteine cluster protein [Candidatus Gastranaerophilales bacterium]|nr:YkgJ family cysteine cluster protein [Candidatus Gastranaerophilales bacterium]
MKNLLLKFKKFFHYYILRRKYFREGACKACGRCCREIYVRHSRDVIKTEEEFNSLKNRHYFYGYLKIIGQNETGLVFACTKLDKETGKCTAYNTRPLLCRQYPVEEIFMMGGSISDDCGYKFVPIKTFEEILRKLK